MGRSDLLIGSATVDGSLSPRLDIAARSPRSSTPPQPLLGNIMEKKIAVLGTGANGSCIAADLTNAGLDVVLIDQWPAHIEAMRANGLHVTLRQGEIHAKVRAYHLCELASMHQVFDVVFLVTKAYDTRWHAELIKPYLKPDGFLIGLQNGMTATIIADVVGPSRTLGCVPELSSYCFVPGQIKRNTAPDRTWFALGSFHPATDGRVEEVAGNSASRRKG